MKWRVDSPKAARPTVALKLNGSLERHNKPLLALFLLSVRYLNSDIWYSVLAVHCAIVAVISWIFFYTKTLLRFTSSFEDFPNSDVKHIDLLVHN